MAAKVYVDGLLDGCIAETAIDPPTLPQRLTAKVVIVGNAIRLELWGGEHENLLAVMALPLDAVGVLGLDQVVAGEGTDQCGRPIRSGATGKVIAFCNQREPHRDCSWLLGNVSLNAADQARRPPSE